MVLYNISTVYVEIVRGIPLIVIILYVAFGLTPVIRDLANQIGIWGLGWASNYFFAGIFKSLANFSIRDVSDELRADIALAFGYGAFEAEVFRAGIQSIGRGQMEAARSLGMSYIQAMRYIILPQAIRRVLPPLGNDFIALLKRFFFSHRAGGQRINPIKPLTPFQYLPGVGNIQCRCFPLPEYDPAALSRCTFA